MTSLEDAAERNDVSTRRTTPTDQRRGEKQPMAESESFGTKVCRYNWHSAAGSLGWPFSMLKYKHFSFK